MKKAKQEWASREKKKFRGSEGKRDIQMEKKK